VVKNVERGEPNRETIERARQGDRTAFAQLVELYQVPVYNLAYRMLGTAVEAEDAAQETFLRAFSQIKSYRTQYKFVPWLLSIASHYCIDRLRRGKGWRWLSLDDEPVGEAVRAETPDPEASALSGERADEAQRLVQKLPPAYRLVVTLKYWNEMSIEEIAQVVNESVANVKVKLYRARQMMAQEYARETQTQLRPVLRGVVSDAS
jgi:RNA polymerase sigma-70 factor (ECF subfamily)